MIRLDSSQTDFAERFTELVEARRGSDADVARDVAAIIDSIRREGDTALHDLTRRFDGHDLDESGWWIGPDECRKALDGLDAELRAALELAHGRILAWHERQRPADIDVTDEAGVRLGARWTAVEAAGIYVPGGRAAYPSSVLMNAVPARVAGVERLVMVTPTPEGRANPLVLAAAALCKVDRVWRVGGAQAVAALAWGTERIVPVDVITGPGNQWVAEAKRQVAGRVGIDMIAGPSEIVVVADGANAPLSLAADLMSQSEHDPTSQSILMTDSADLADGVVDAVEEVIGRLATEATMRAAWDSHGAVIVLGSLDEAPPLIDRLAPEHLQLAIAHPRALFERVRHAGSVFLGRCTPEAVGDYVAGPNHVLPTGRRARYSSGLGVSDFCKRTTVLELDRKALAAIGPAAVALARAEGLPAHALSVAQRLAVE